MSSIPNDSRHASVASIALVLLTAVLYAPVLGHAFVSIDTALYLTENPHVLAGLTWSSLGWAFTAFHAANWHPITWLSHMLDVQLFGNSPAGHHLVNVGLHAANSVLVFLLLRRMTARFGASLTVAMLFAVHPLHVESVAWIVERKDVLSTFFGLLSLIAWTNYASKGTKRAYVAALALFALSLMSKPMLVTLPFALLAFDAWPLCRLQRSWGALVLEKAPFLALSIASSCVTIAAQAAGRALQDTRALALGARIENAVASVGWYASKAVWPSELSFYYPLARGGVGASDIVTGALVLIGATALSIGTLRARPWIATGWLFLLGTLVPVIGLVQVGGQAHADRYVYLPILGLFVALVWTADELVESPLAKRVLAVAFCLVLGLLARDRIGAWQDSETLARRALAVDAGNAVAHDLLGWTLIERGRYAAGLDHLRTAVALQPGDPDAHRNLGRALLRCGLIDDAENEMRAVVALRPDDPRSLLELGALLVLRGRLDEARVLLIRARERSPADPNVSIALGELFEKQGDSAGAEREFEAALALDRSSLRANVDLAGVRIAQSRLDEAARLLDMALSIDPVSPQALQQRARILGARGDAAGAVRDLRAALGARADWPLAMADLAWILATSRDSTLRAPDEALALASRAVDSGNEGRSLYLDTLATALAANGRFDEAVRFAKLAGDAARKEADAMAAESIARRLAAYQQRSMEGVTPRR